MPDDRKKMFSKKGTGTVPKVKHRNNTTYTNQGDFQRNLSNNLVGIKRPDYSRLEKETIIAKYFYTKKGLDWQQRQDYSNYSRNSERNFYQLNPFQMETTFAEDHRQNGVGHLNMSANGTVSTSSTSGSNSRRDSVGTIPKCDNVKKCPDKKRIEDKLNQIREYLRVTTSLMSSIKNTDDQSAMKEKEDFERMIKDLKDSEAKLLVLLSDPIYNDSSAEQNVEEENHNMDLAVSEHMQRFSQLLDILTCQQNKFNNIYNTNNGPTENGTDNLSEASVSGYQRNPLEEKVEFTNRKVQLLREQQNALINLKRKAENQLREAQQAQENLLLLQQQKPKAEQTCSEFHDKNLSVARFDVAIKELEDKLESMRNEPRRPALSNQQDTAQEEAEYISEQLENSNHFMQFLDNSDSQLNGEHIELQQKLNELQSKKLQIDQLAQQLQHLGDEDDEDIGNQVRKIVTMKQQLSSLKDLLEIVKNTEFSLLDSQNVNELIDSESLDAAHGICAKTDNIRQDVRSNINHNENGMRLETNASRANEQWLEKQSNKSILSLQEREKVLAELKAKKRELEEIMYKQKDRTSINNDVCSEASANKSDMSANNNMFDGVVLSWLPIQPNQHNQMATAYSSDECPDEDINEYLNSATEATAGSTIQAQPSIISNFSASSYNKGPSSEQRSDRNPSGEYMRRVSPAIHEPRTRTISAGTFERERAGSNSLSETDTTTLQKQLELIHGVCQSLLDQQTSNNNQQLRNNLMYADPHSYMTSNVRQIGVNGSAEMPAYMNSQVMNSQCFGMGDVTNNQNMLTANTLQTQAFLLNTLNQCCQMLWFQQREIATLRNMICTMQEQIISGQIEQDVNAVPPPSNSYVFPARPTSSLSNFRAPSQSRNVANPKVNQVSAACSLPNLNPPPPPPQHANIESAYLNQNNIRSSPSARLLESSLNNAAQLHSHHNLSGGEQSPANNTVLPGVNVNGASISQSLPSQIWNGQALNNQVAPGNRANNYWDNFRSYSRQNLLSTSSKSNEGLQHSAAVLDRSNATYDRSHPFPLPPYTSPKLNTVHNESVSASEESTPRRHLHFKTSQNIGTNKPSIAAIPPDVLNINHNTTHQKTNEHQELLGDISLDLNIPENNLSSEVNGAVGDGRIFKDYSIGGRNRNEWHHENDHSDNLPKSKLFEELRDNVYKEVANLISANESRPHFLIQLFRDLQQINSDPLRGRTLQSIQTVITNSLNVSDNTRGASRQSVGAQQATSEQELAQVDSESYSLQHLWSQSPVSTSRDSCNTEVENVDDPDIYNILKTIFSFLKSHDDDILQQELTELLKGLIIKAMPFNEIFGNSHIQERTFHKHFLAILNDVLEKYQGRRVAEIKKDLLKTISDLLIGEFSFIYLIQENIPESCESNPLPPSNNLPILNDVINLNIQKQPNKSASENGAMPQMQNGDLAEADQSRIELQEEEGAVGGVLNILGDATTHIDLVDSNATETPKIDFPINAESEVEFAEQGLDQVPTRLTTRSRSSSNTPNRDRSNSSRSDPMEHF